MIHKMAGPALIAAFFESLTERNAAQCKQLLQELTGLPDYTLWSDYLLGIYIFEFEYDFSQSEQIFRQLQVNPLEPMLHARVLVALGRVVDIQGRWNDAVNSYTESLSIYAELAQPLEQVKVWKNIAATYCKGFNEGDLGIEALVQAQACCQKAFAALQTVNDGSSAMAWLEGSLWNTLGTVHLARKEWQQAIYCYQQDLTLCILHTDRYGMSISYLNLGEVYQKQRDLSAALLAYQTALALIREFADAYVELDILASLGALYEELADYLSAHNYYQQAILLVEAIRSEISSEEARTAFFATMVNTYYAHLILLCVAHGHLAEAFAYVEQARTRTLLDQLTADTLLQTTSDRSITLAQVQATLTADTAVLAYFTTGVIEEAKSRFRMQPEFERHRFPLEKILIFAITTGTITVIDANLSPNKLLPRRTEELVERYFLQPAIRSLLYTRLVKPVEAQVVHKQLLYLIPHGPLHFVPWSALLKETNQSWITDNGPHIVYAMSASLLLRKQLSRPKQAEQKCLAIGYNGEGDTRLVHAEGEAAWIAQISAGTALIGSLPKKQQVYAWASAYQQLHFSCHGEFVWAMPLDSALHLAPNEILTVREVSKNLQLNGALVTLSACESGLGHVQRGDEVYGFARAFLQAGAGVVLATLWRVDERATWLFMREFYTAIQQGVDLPGAMHRAQIYLRTLTRQRAATHVAIRVDELAEMPFADPCYWAAFILVINNLGSIQ